MNHEEFVKSLMKTCAEHGCPLVCERKAQWEAECALEEHILDNPALDDYDRSRIADQFQKNYGHFLAYSEEEAAQYREVYG